MPQDVFNYLARVCSGLLLYKLEVSKRYTLLKKHYCQSKIVYIYIIYITWLLHIYIYILLHPCILGNRGGLKVINSSDKPLFMYFLINIYKITCIQYTCIHRSNIIYNYHHSTKLYRKISRVCCRLYCYECAARVTMPTATNE